MKSAKPKPNAPKPLSLAEKLQQDQAEAQRWNQVANNPDLSLPAALFARNMARSSQAMLELSQKALAYQDESQRNQQQALAGNLDRALRIARLPQEQAPSLAPQNPPSSTAPGTSA